MIKTLFLKDRYDFHGPDSEYNYEDVSVDKILSFFKRKVYLFETLIYFKADVKIIDSGYIKDWILDARKDSKVFYEYNGTSTPLNEIKFKGYDLVITSDPILHPSFMRKMRKLSPKTLFAFISAEHAYWKNHIHGLEYDLFLDHTYSAKQTCNSLPCDLNFLFPRVPNIMQKMYDCKTKESIYVDNRTINLLNRNKIDSNSLVKMFNSKVPSLKVLLPSKLALEPWLINTSNLKDNYYEKLALSKYFISIERRIDQAAFDAASLSCLVIGNKTSKAHKMLCHPSCLMDVSTNIDDLIKFIQLLENDEKLFDSLLKIQNENFKKIVVDDPIKGVLKCQALPRKRKPITKFEKFNLLVRRIIPHIYFKGRNYFLLRFLIAIYFSLRYVYISPTYSLKEPKTV